MGIIYAFHGERAVGDSVLSEKYRSFSGFLDLCISDPTAAEALLSEKGAGSAEASALIAKYSKEARRLHVDLRHSLECKSLAIRQRLESEFLDVLPPEFDLALLQKLAEHVVPAVARRSAGLALPNGIAPPDSVPITINMSSNVIQSAYGIVANEISGLTHLTVQDKELISLFQNNAGPEAAELTSALHELNDASAPREGRITAKQKIKRFLIDCSSKVASAGLNILEKYIESKVLGL
jgi:hypothetical protein